MKTFYVSLNCGCCDDELRFEDEARIIAAFNKVGLTSSATIVDDEGVVHEDIDTFYGYSENDDTQAERDLNYLIDRIRASG